MSKSLSPVLIIGGSGVVGAQAAQTLRRLHPDVPIVIGGRDAEKAAAVAARVGAVGGVKVDLARRDLGQADSSYSAVVAFVKDEGLQSMRYAQDHQLPYLSLSSGTFEIGPEVAQYVHAPSRAPILLGSHWLLGAALFPTLHFARDFHALESIRIGLLLDTEDMGGPAAWVDFQRITAAAPAALVLEAGKFTWVMGESAKASYRSVDGVELEASAYSPYDVLSLATATAARNVRIDLAVAASSSRRRGEPLSTEIAIELEGTDRNGAPTRTRHEIVHPGGQAPLTALGVALAVERLLGRAGGDAPAPGLYLPEVLIDPAYFVGRMVELGARFALGR